MQLSDFLEYKDIVLQCHDHPDADTIAAAYGLYIYFKSNGKKTRLVYTGTDQITKSNLKLMLTELKIPLEYIKGLEFSPDLLITVDCQYGEGNVTHLEAKHVASIDHHQDCGNPMDFSIICDTYGSCATLVYKMLQEEGYPIWLDRNLMTALYFGLYMDTNAFSEVRHPLDMDMIEELKPDDALIVRLKNCNFTFAELEIAANAMIRYSYSESMRFAIVRANPCDPNLLGFISDLVLQVDGVDTSIAYCELDYGYKLSIRNCNRYIRSSEVMDYLVSDIGSGGGHNNKAGGYIVKSKYEAKYGEMNLLGYILNAMPKFYKSYDIVDLSSDNMDITDMRLYEHLPVRYGVCQSTDLAEHGQHILIRTEHAGYDFIADSNTNLLFGTDGAVFQVGKEAFQNRYQMMENEFECTMKYRTMIRTEGVQQGIRIQDYLKCCISRPKYKVFARELDRAIKIFRNYDYTEYMYGTPGDYLVVMTEEENNVLIVKKKAFETSYRLVPGEVCENNDPQEEW